MLWIFVSFFCEMFAKDYNPDCHLFVDQDDCENSFLATEDYCMWKWGDPPACVWEDDLECVELGIEHCDFYPYCFINDFGDCQIDPCAYEEFTTPTDVCETPNCIARLMYDYEYGEYTNWTLCTSANHVPDPCYYLGHFSYDNETEEYAYQDSVCTGIPGCRNVHKDDPALITHNLCWGKEEKSSALVPSAHSVAVICLISLAFITKFFFCGVVL